MEDKDFRAKQFMPFDALKGFYDLIDDENIIIKDRKELSVDMETELNDKFKKLKKGDNVLIKHYHNIDYIETTGVIKKIDTIYKIVYLLNCKISLDDIIDIIKI